MKSIQRLLTVSLLLTACAASAPPAPAGTAVPFASAIQVAVASNDFSVGTPRVPFVLFSGTQRVADAQRVKLTAFDLTPQTPAPGWTGEAINYGDYEVPYWVAYPELPHAGNWGLAAEVTLGDGTVAQSQFAIRVDDQATSPAIGARPPASQSRTLKTEPDIHKLTSDADPDPGLYQMTVAEAMASGRPSVITFATPAYCASRLCAPVLSSVKSVYTELGDRANFIHVEVYKSFDSLVYADEMGEWGLSSEPWTFVLDGEGKVAAKFGGPLSPRELEAALIPLLPK